VVPEGTSMPPKRIVAGEPDHTGLAAVSRRLQRLVEKLGLAERRTASNRRRVPEGTCTLPSCKGQEPGGRGSLQVAMVVGLVFVGAAPAKGLLDAVWVVPAVDVAEQRQLGLIAGLEAVR
jgi:hypothetical protein